MGFREQQRIRQTAERIIAVSKTHFGLGPMLEAQRRERDLLVREFAQVRGLMPLLMKHRNGGRWTREERQELNEQLNALAHLSPYLVVLAMPGSFMIMPVLAWWLDRRRIQRTMPRLDTRN